MGIFEAVKKAKEKINEAMARVHNRKNYTEKEDLTHYHEKLSEEIHT